MYLYLIIVHFDQTSQSRVMKNVHHFKLVHHPRFEWSTTMHDLGCKVSSSKSMYNKIVLNDYSLFLIGLYFFFSTMIEKKCHDE